MQLATSKSVKHIVIIPIMRTHPTQLIILICLFFSCQKTDVNYIAEPFYNRCSVESINNTNVLASTNIKYQYDHNGNLMFKLHKDLSTNSFIALDTIYYLPNGLIGRIEYQDINNRALPKSTYSHNYNNTIIERIYETGFINNFPYVITYNYSFSGEKIERIEKIGDLIHPNYTLTNFIYSAENIISCELQFENLYDIIELRFTTDKQANIKKQLLPYPNSILFTSTQNNITQITNTQSFYLNGIQYAANSVLFNQKLIFNDEGALLTAIENKSELGIFSAAPSIQHFSYNCE